MTIFSDLDCDVNPVDHIRLQEQTRLDAARSQRERNRLGQFATPPQLAADILACAVRLLPEHAPIRFLDPAVGTGAFFAAFLDAFPPEQRAAAVGYDIDPAYAGVARRLWSDRGLQVRLADFTVPLTSDADRFNLIICNPPYVRHHHLPAAEKARLQDSVYHTTGIRISGLAGLYCYFLLLSHARLAPEGLAGWLIPSEFMAVNYGHSLRAYLLDHVTLLRIHRFDPTDVQFDDALVSSAVVWFRNAPPPHDHRVVFTFGGSLAQPALSESVPIASLRVTRKWTSFPASPATATGNVAPGLPSSEVPVRLADLFDIRRGIATGANDFFILSAESVARLELPRRFLQPILPSPRYITTDEILADPDGLPLISPRLFLLACNLPEDRVRADYPALWAYLESGKARGLHNRYLSQHRSPWYAQETRAPGRFLCSYMGRSDRPAATPFRFILNHSQAITANVYLLLYPRPALRSALNSDPDASHRLLHRLNAISPETLLGEGRVYGGGLYKLEPKELANVPAANLIDNLQFHRQFALF